MYRKLVLALGATTVIAAAALAPTSASAFGWGWKHHHHHFGHWGFGIYAPTYVADGDCYRVKRTYERPDGSIRVRYVLVCD